MSCFGAKHGPTVKLKMVQNCAIISSYLWKDHNRTQPSSVRCCQVFQLHEEFQHLLGLGIEKRRNCHFPCQGHSNVGDPLWIGSVGAYMTKIFVYRDLNLLQILVLPLGCTDANLRPTGTTTVMAHIARKVSSRLIINGTICADPSKINMIIMVVNPVEKVLIAGMGMRTERNAL